MTRKEGMKNLSVTMSEDELKEVHALARNKKFKITADYIRALIVEDAKAQGKLIEFEVDRGGDRKSSSGEGQ